MPPFKFDDYLHIAKSTPHYRVDRDELKLTKLGYINPLLFSHSRSSTSSSQMPLLRERISHWRYSPITRLPPTLLLTPQFKQHINRHNLIPSMASPSYHYNLARESAKLALSDWSKSSPFFPTHRIFKSQYNRKLATPLRSSTHWTDETKLNLSGYPIERMQNNRFSRFSSIASTLIDDHPSSKRPSGESSPYAKFVSHISEQPSPTRSLRNLPKTHPFTARHHAFSTIYFPYTLSGDSHINITNCEKDNVLGDVPPTMLSPAPKDKIFIPRVRPRVRDALPM